MAIPEININIAVICRHVNLLLSNSLEKIAVDGATRERIMTVKEGLT